MKAITICTKAMRLIGVLAASETLEGNDQEDTLDALNMMLASWENQGVELNIDTLGAEDDLNLSDVHNEAIIYNLAMRRAPEYSKLINPDVREVARQGLDHLKAIYSTGELLQVDSGLRRRYRDRGSYR